MGYRHLYSLKVGGTWERGLLILPRGPVSSTTDLLLDPHGSPFSTLFLLFITFGWP